MNPTDLPKVWIETECVSVIRRLGLGSCVVRLWAHEEPLSDVPMVCYAPDATQPSVPAPHAIAAWCSWFRARLERIAAGSSEDYTGQEMDLYNVFNEAGQAETQWSPQGCSGGGPSCGSCSPCPVAGWENEGGKAAP